MGTLPLEKYMEEKEKGSEKYEEWVELLREIRRGDYSSEKVEEAMTMLCGGDLSLCCSSDKDCPLRDSLLIAMGRKEGDDENSI